MARPYACRSPCQNPFPTGGNKLARAAPNEGSGTPTFTLTVSQAPTPALVVTPIVISNPDNELFKQFMKVYLEAQTPAETSAEMDTEPCKRPFKAWLPDLYYRDLHIECYWFC